MKKVIIMVLIFMLCSGCQSIHYTKDSPDGTKESYEKTGWIDWSDSKNISVPISGIGI